MYDFLKKRRTKMGFSLDQAIQTGVDNATSAAAAEVTINNIMEVNTQVLEVFPEIQAVGVVAGMSA